MFGIRTLRSRINIKDYQSLGLKILIGKKNKLHKEFKTIEDAKKWIIMEDSDFYELFTVEI